MLSHTFANVLVGIAVASWAALLGGIGYLIRSQRGDRARLNQTLTELQTYVAVAKVDDVRIVADVEHLKRQVPQLAENLAVLTEIVERHERWHERHDPT